MRSKHNQKANFDRSDSSNILWDLAEDVPCSQNPPVALRVFTKFSVLMFRFEDITLTHDTDWAEKLYS